MTAPPPAPRRVLLALDGRALTKAGLEAALRTCVHLTSRLDILVVYPPRAPASLLAVLLLKLEHSGVDYRLASAQEDLGVAVERYLKRYRGKLTVVSAAPATEADAANWRALETLDCTLLAWA
jgi:nucleotide-binding universal stress UspA family protein